MGRYNLIDADQVITRQIDITRDASIVGDVDTPKTCIFQFPPKITSDSKNIAWDVVRTYATYEPQYNWKGGGARKLTITSTYIVGGPSLTDGKPATPENIAKAIRIWKAYFYADGTKDALLPIFKIKAYEHVPSGGTTYRGISVSVKHGDSHILDTNIKVFPLRSDVTLTVEQVTNIKSNDGLTQYQYTNIPDEPIQEWY